jgi:hypothetical protein
MRLRTIYYLFGHQLGRAARRVDDRLHRRETSADPVKNLGPHRHWREGDPAVSSRKGCTHLKNQCHLSVAGFCELASGLQVPIFGILGGK